MTGVAQTENARVKTCRLPSFAIRVRQEADSLDNSRTFRGGGQEAVHLYRDCLLDHDQHNSPARLGFLPANSSQTELSVGSGASLIGPHRECAHDCKSLQLSLSSERMSLKRAIFSVA